MPLPNNVFGLPATGDMYFPDRYYAYSPHPLFWMETDNFLVRPFTLCATRCTPYKNHAVFIGRSCNLAGQPMMYMHLLAHKHTR